MAKQVDQDQKLAEITEGAVLLIERIEPLREAAEGYRAQLIAQDWSPPVAESIAAKFLIDLTTRLLTQPEDTNDD